jgi:hypothetical protein
MEVVLLSIISMSAHKKKRKRKTNLVERMLWGIDSLGLELDTENMNGLQFSLVAANDNFNENGFS